MKLKKFVVVVNIKTGKYVPFTYAGNGEVILPPGVNEDDCIVTMADYHDIDWETDIVYRKELPLVIKKGEYGKERLNIQRAN